MDQQFIDLSNKKITAYYQEVKDLLFNQESYVSSVDTKNVEFYFSYLEASLEMPYNRLKSVCIYIQSDNNPLADYMYPFALLQKEVKDEIDVLFARGGSLVRALEVSGIDPELESLCEEKHQKMNRISTISSQSRI